MDNLVLSPEKDFIDNSEYLSNLVSRINKYKIYDDDMLQEIMQADYYVNRLIRFNDSCDSQYVDSLKSISTVFEGVLDSVHSKKLLSLNDCNKCYKSLESKIDKIESKFRIISRVRLNLYGDVVSFMISTCAILLSCCILVIILFC